MRLTREQDPIVFIRMQIENAWEQGDADRALAMSRMMDEQMMLLVQEELTAQKKVL